ncbi:antitoxin [Candidatus Desantisbacteria bacterium CG1_02_38_46]|uniref:Antitoxin n=1 Tax=Candidatus Desantisbacteria bacterium CG1_02_38_46 TaxID=1817893 RepID=A0A1J4SEH8_9BACT|nr:MAG: antitoxin [Candidatus Desantisbacteria bacterium CG1_02_38_46]
MFTRIVVDPTIQHGKPCIKGTRIPVYVVLESLAQGLTYEKIKDEYPFLNEEDIKECILYAAMLTNEEEIVPKMVDVKQ